MDSTWESWEILESKETKLFHRRGHPCLISSLVLRSRGMGQIDVATLQKIGTRKVLTLVEVKTSTVPGSFQWQRLKKSQDFLAKLLEVETKLEVKFCQKDQDSLFF